MGYLYGKIEDKDKFIEDKNKEITELKATADDLNCQIVEKEKEINQVGVALEFSMAETRET